MRSVWALVMAVAAGCSSEASRARSARPLAAESVIAATEFLASRSPEVSQRFSNRTLPFVAKNDVVQSLQLPTGFADQLSVKAPQTGELPIEIGGLRLSPIG